MSIKFTDIILITSKSRHYPWLQSISIKYLLLGYNHVKIIAKTMLTILSKLGIKLINSQKICHVANSFVRWWQVEGYYFVKVVVCIVFTFHSSKIVFTWNFGENFCVGLWLITEARRFYTYLISTVCLFNAELLRNLNTMHLNFLFKIPEISPVTGYAKLWHLSNHWTSNGANNLN